MEALFTDFEDPHGLFSDSNGDLIVVDSNNDRVRSIERVTGLVSTLAGGYTGDGGSAKQASLNLPDAIAIDSARNLYVADEFNYRIRRLDRTGKMMTIAGNGVSGYSGDGGPATAASIFLPIAITADRSGNVYFADQAGEVLRKVDSNGTITTVHINGTLIYVAGLATDPRGNVFAADFATCVVWKIAPSGSIIPVAGSFANCGYNGDGIPSTQALLNEPWGIALDHDGNLFIADFSNNRIRRVDGTTGLISTVAGNGGCGFSGDGGPATSAALCEPIDVAVNGAGMVYIADDGNLRIRSVDPAGIIQTLAGTGLAGYNGERIPAGETNFDCPAGVAVDGQGGVYVVDQSQSRVRKIQ